MARRRSGAERHRGREAALQLLYQWEIGRLTPERREEAASRYWRDRPAPAPRQAFASGLVEGTIGHLETIDPLLEAHADNWRLSRMAVVDRLILRMAVYELIHSDTPPPVVIDEAVELARTFGTERTGSFVNGVLEGVRRTAPAGSAPKSELCAHARQTSCGSGVTT